MSTHRPRHIAIIMDGNGRWAKARGLPRLEGHRLGVETVETIVTSAREWKIPFLTLYAFSDENWNRPDEEVQALMLLLENYLKAKQEKMIRNGIRFHAIGDLQKLPARVRGVLDETRRVTAGGDGTNLILALSYGARNEIVRAVNSRIAQSGGPVTEDSFSASLDTDPFPDPDLLIRTGGEFRLSNFLLWQLAYTELYFTKTMWPDFTPAELKRAMEAFAKRERRFGKTSEQVAS